MTSYLNLKNGKTTKIKAQRRFNRRSNNNNNNNVNRMNINNRRGRRRGRGRGGRIRNGRNNINYNIRSLQGVQYSLNETLTKEALCYSEAVVCPFADEAVGCKRPDGQIGTTPCTDRYSGLLGLVEQSQHFSPPSGASISGICISFIPRSLAVNWIRGNIDDGKCKPYLSILELDSNLNGIVNDIQSGSKYRSVVSDPYCLLYTILGSDGKFYRFDTVPGDFTLSFEEGINLIRTPRLNSIYNNFDTLRILGAGIKLWPNSAPVQTGGRVFSGSFRLSDFYDILGGGDLDRSTVNATNLETALKDNYKTFVGLDGTTIRYNPLMDRKQLELQDMQINLFATTGEDDENHYTEYFLDSANTVQLYDLATPNCYAPVVIWRYGNETVYDITFRMVVHNEGGTDGVCPFEADAVISDHNILHLDKFLMSSHFDRYVKGHTFAKFINKAKKFVGHVQKGTAKAVQIINLIEKFAGML
jgi:hypothetical protein